MVLKRVLVPRTGVVVLTDGPAFRSWTTGSPGSESGSRVCWARRLSWHLGTGAYGDRYVPAVSTA